MQVETEGEISGNCGDGRTTAPFPPGNPFKSRAVILTLVTIFCAGAWLKAQTSEISDISGEYEFLNADNTLAILDEDGKLKGYIDVFQGENESDALLSYDITIGSRSKDHVEFRTQKIHEKYYRFSGAAARGTGRASGDPDYLQLTGELATITENSVTGQEKVDRQRVIFKLKGRNEKGP